MRMLLARNLLLALSGDAGNVRKVKCSILYATLEPHFDVYLREQRFNRQFPHLKTML